MLTFDVGKYHAEFGLFKGRESFPSSFACYGYGVLVSDKAMKIVDLYHSDPRMLHHESFKGNGFCYARVDLIKNLSPSIANDKPYIFYERYLSDCCRFAQVLLSLPPGGNVELTLILS